jgi:trimethylamine-N-oxide reductase (cytochrome c)
MSQHSDIPSLREIDRVIGPDGYSYNRLQINKEDADARGIVDGDICKVFNERGVVLVGARITEQVIPGVIAVQKGGGGDDIIPGKVNRGGNINCINVQGKTLSLHALVFCTMVI